MQCSKPYSPQLHSARLRKSLDTCEKVLRALPSPPLFVLLLSVFHCHQADTMARSLALSSWIQRPPLPPHQPPLLPLQGDSPTLLLLLTRYTCPYPSQSLSKPSFYGERKEPPNTKTHKQLFCRSVRHSIFWGFCLCG